MLKAKNEMLRSRVPKKRIFLKQDERERLLKLGAAIGPGASKLITIVHHRTYQRWVRETGRRSCIVPTDKRKHLATELVAAHRNEDSPSAFILNGPDHSLNNSNIAVFADGTIARWLDAFALDPPPESVAVPVTDDVLRCPIGTTVCWSIRKDTNAHNAAGETIYDDY